MNRWYWKLLPGLAVVILPLTAHAQFVALKTVPMSTGEQFRIFPAERPGMAGLSIALADEQLDPWVNPARGAGLRSLRVQTLPSFYGIAKDNGGALTLPTSIQAAATRYFGGAVIALQSMDLGRHPFDVPVLPVALPVRERAVTNRYLASYAGVRPFERVSLGASVFHATVRGVDGVSRLYPSSVNVDQRGTIAELRAGFLYQTPGGSEFELVLAQNRVRVRHDVLYADTTPGAAQVLRPELNRDETDNSGVQFGYRRTLRAGWTLGGLLLANHKDHSSLPNYEVQKIPRDPGRSRAYHIGVGAARQVGDIVFGADVIYEPAWSSTWGEAGEPIATTRGRIIQPGEHTVDNRFAFRNKLLRLGMGRSLETLSYQFGIQFKHIAWVLEQQNRVEHTAHGLDQAWTEFKPSWSLLYRFPALTVRYNGYMHSNGLGGDVHPGNEPVSQDDIGDFIPAPREYVLIDDFRVWVHQLTISIPLR